MQFVTTYIHQHQNFISLQFAVHCKFLHQPYNGNDLAVCCEATARTKFWLLTVLLSSSRSVMASAIFCHPIHDWRLKSTSHFKTAHTTHLFPSSSLTSPMKVCSKLQLVSFLGKLTASPGYSLNQIPVICFFKWSISPANFPANEWREFSGVNITLFLTGCSAQSTSGWFPQPHTLRASVYVVLGGF